MKPINAAGTALAVFLLSVLSACEQETGADISNRIAKACTDEYGSQGDQAVLECKMRQTTKAMDRIRAGHESAVDSAVGH